MAQTAVARTPSSGGLAEVIDIILDKGLVVDAFVRVSLVGIELVTIDARIVIASVDTYLHFAEAVNRLDLRAKAEGDDADIQDLIGGAQAAGAQTVAKKGLKGLTSASGDLLEDVSNRVQEMVGTDEDDDGDADDDE